MLIENLKSGLKIMQSKLFNKKIPLIITYIITDKCNRNCAYCNIKNSEKSKIMDANKALSMIRELRSHGMQLINFTGGEPLLRKDIGALISFASRIGVKTILTTNGDYVKENIKKIKDINLIYLCLNGRKKVHDALRGKGSYDKTINAMKIARKRNISVAINMILTNKNLNQIDFVYKKAREQNARAYFTPVYDFKLVNITKKQLDRIKPADEEIKRAFKLVKKLKKEKGFVLNSTKYIDYIIKSGYKPYHFKRCLMGKLVFVIKPNGDVAPCYKFVDRKKLVNLTKTSCADALKSMKTADCHDCNFNCHIEQNLLLGFEPSAIINLLQNYGGFGK